MPFDANQSLIVAQSVLDSTQAQLKAAQADLDVRTAALLSAQAAFNVASDRVTAMTALINGLSSLVEVEGVAIAQQSVVSITPVISPPTL